MNRTTPWEAAGLLLAVIASLYTHAIVLDSFIAPTYGNTGVHFATMRHIVEHGDYPMEDYSYGGGIRNLYVPLFRITGASLALLTGWDLDFIARALVLLIATLLPVGTWALARRVAPERYAVIAGVSSALLASVIPELLFYTVRPLPQALGHALLPFAWWALARQDVKLTALLSVLVALIHQEAAVFHAGVTFALGLIALTLAWLDKNQRTSWLRIAALGFVGWAAVTGTYLAWHFLIAQGPFFTEMAQFKHKEGNPLQLHDYWDKGGWLFALTSAIGLIWLLSQVLRRRVNSDAALLLALVGVGVFCVKNDVIGIRVFMDRFLVYLQQAALPLAGLACAWAWTRAQQAADWLEGKPERE